VQILVYLMTSYPYSLLHQTVMVPLFTKSNKHAHPVILPTSLAGEEM